MERIPLYFIILSSMLTGLLKEQLGIQYNTKPPGGSTPMKQINAWFHIRIKKGTKKEVKK
jgi:hypothetical protein